MEKLSKQNIKNIFSRRSFMLGGVISLLGGGLVTRLGYLQIHQASLYKLQSDKNRLRVKRIAPKRGKIIDKHGIILADNLLNYNIMLDNDVGVNYLKDKVLFKQLCEWLDINDTEHDILKHYLLERQYDDAVVLKTHITFEDLARYSVKAHALPAVYFGETWRRYYPYRNSVSHILGYIKKPSKKDIKRDAIYKVSNMHIGSTGIEAYGEHIIRGDVGLVHQEINALGKVVNILGEQPARTGDNITLTLNTRLQEYITELLSKHMVATAMVMDIPSGAIEAMVSHPSFDNNIFTKPMSHTIWNDLNNDATKPLLNRASRGGYPPGSTVKMLSALHGLEQGYGQYFTTTCKGYIDFGGTRYHCWNKHGHGKVDCVAAIRESCDVWFYEMAQKFNQDNLAQVFRRFGLGKKLDFYDISNINGLVPDKAWKKQHFNESWFQGETLHASIGQGYVITTPLQLLYMTANLVRGFDIKPRLIMDDPIIQGDALLKPAHHKLIMNAMEQVVNHPRGTAHRLHDASFRMGGKTGTAQVRTIKALERDGEVIKNEDLAWDLRDHALFVGYAPIKNPKYAVCVVVEHGGSGSAVAAPIAQKILKASYYYNQHI